MRTSEVNTVTSSIWDASVCLPMLVQRGSVTIHVQELKRGYTHTKGDLSQVSLE